MAPNKKTVVKKDYDYSELEEGMSVQAESEGAYYSAKIVQVSTSKNRSKAPVKVSFKGYEAFYDEWVGGDRLRSKALEIKTPLQKQKAGRAPDQFTIGSEVALKRVAKVYRGKVKDEADALKVDAAVNELHAKLSEGKKDKTKGFVKTTRTVCKTEWAYECSVVWRSLDDFKAYDGSEYTAFEAKLKGLIVGELYSGARAYDELGSGVIAPVPGEAVAMPKSTPTMLMSKANVDAPLDPDFSPLYLGKKQYLQATKNCTDKLKWALPRPGGCGRGELPVFPEGHKNCDASVYMASVLINNMMWERAAASLELSGPAWMTASMVAAYTTDGPCSFEVKNMPNACGTPDTPFGVTVVAAKDLSKAKETPSKCGTEANGSRLAFDLGKSDIKVVVVKDNEVLYSKETEWDVTNVDPDYHFNAIKAAMEIGKAELEKTGSKIEAIGGSATGAISANSEATWCDCFPNVPPDVYQEKVVNIFHRLRDALAPGVPLKVINDGEVTALAAYSKLGGKGNILGISMGSSEGGGYANKDGDLLGWINELCFLKLDLNPEAPHDPWTKGTHSGISHMYLGQRGATKLAKAGGIEAPENQLWPHPDMCTIKHDNHAQCLKLIQKAMTDPAKEPQARKIYETVGVYLGYGLCQYLDHYRIDHLMILGRVSKGAGGDIMLEVAKSVLAKEKPKVKIEFHTADDHFKAVGQCIAAAALPELKK